MIRPTLTLALLALGCLASTGQMRGRPEMHPLLRKVAESHDKVKLIGIRTVFVGAPGELRPVTEKVVRDGLKVRVEVLEGERTGMVIIEDGRRRLAFMSKDKHARELPPKEFEFVGRLSRRVMARATVKESDGGLVAGKATRLLEADTPNGTVRVWVATSPPCVLRFQALGEDGRLRAGFEFNRVEFNPKIPADAFKLATSARVVTPEEDLAALSKRFGMKPYRLPKLPNFQLIGVRAIPTGAARVVMQSYRTPKGPVSLFQLIGDVQPDRLRRAASERAKVYSWKVDNVTLVLVGPMDEAYLRRLAGSVRA